MSLPRPFRCGAVLVAVLCPQVGNACLSPFAEDHHYPTCTIPMPSEGDTVTIVDQGAPVAYVDLHFGNPDVPTWLVKVRVDANNARNYIVLASYIPTIFEFSGDTDSIVSVIALGAEDLGPGQVGVIGIPPKKVHFTVDDISAVPEIAKTSCTRIKLACSPWQWFENSQPLGVREMVYYPPIADARLPEPAKAGHVLKRFKRALAGPINIVMPDENFVLESVDPESVVSAVPPIRKN